jgi:hypothetical protein
MKGWFKVYRSLDEHWISQDMEKLGRWTWLLMKASHEDTKVVEGNKVIELKRGQLIASLSLLESKWGVTRKTVMRFLDVLEREEMLHRQVHQGITIITICNYEGYQGKKKCDSTDMSTDKSPLCPPTSPPIQEDKEDKNIYNTPTARTCTREDDFIRRYRTEGMWSDVALILHKPIADCEHLFDRWIIEYQHNGDVHQSYSDFKKHFIQWARITIQKEKSNGDNSKQDKRRGFQVVANSPEDYQGSF